MKIEMIPLELVIPYWNNARNNRKTIKVVEKSIQKFGFNQPIAIDKKNEIIAGHTRYFAAQNLGMKQIPCVRLDLTEQQAKQYRIADNKSHEFSTWDEDKLIRELRTMDATFEMQDFFFEPIGELLGFVEPDAAATASPGGTALVYDADTDEEADDETPEATFTERQQERFEERESRATDALMQKPVEYLEFECPHCGKKITIKK